MKTLKKQQGYALLVFVSLMLAAASTVAVKALNNGNSQIARDQTTAAALAQAKDALIGYAVSRGNIAGTPRPGDLPCPDTDAPGTANYGNEQGTCVAGAVGRLPWKTLGLPELVDAEGEPLWYAVSGNFRRYSIDSNPLNSDTPGSLLIFGNDEGITPVSTQSVAIVFSAGDVLPGQNRDATVSSCPSTGTTIPRNLCSGNYLESLHCPGANCRNNAVAAGPFIAGPVLDANRNPLLNDRLIFVTADNLLAHTEKRVAGEIKNLLKTYYTAWGAYPFASPFAPPSMALFMGNTATYYGLPPLGGLNGIGSYIQPTWNAIPVISFSSGGSADGCELRDGSEINTRWRCNNISLPAGSTMTITGTLNNAGMGFWKLHEINDTGQVRARNSSGNDVLTTSVLDNVSVTGSLNSDGSATVTFRGTGQAGTSSIQRIELRDINNYQTLLPNWFRINSWQQVVYYAVSPGYAPGGGNACTPLPGTPSCLTVDGTHASTNAHAVLVTTGRAVTGTHHPSGTLGDYLEGENVTPANFSYKNQTRSDTFDDQVFIVAP